MLASLHQEYADFKYFMTWRASKPPAGPTPKVSLRYVHMCTLTPLQRPADDDEHPDSSTPKRSKNIPASEVRYAVFAINIPFRLRRRRLLALLMFSLTPRSGGTDERNC